MKKIIILVLSLFFAFCLSSCKKVEDELIADGEYIGSNVYQSPIISSMVSSIHFKIENNQLLISDHRYELEEFTLHENFFDRLLLEEDNTLKDEFLFPSMALHCIISNNDGLINEYCILVSKTKECYIFFNTHNQEDEYGILKAYKLEKDEL